MALPDSKGYAIFESVITASKETPVIILTHLADEKTAIRAMQNKNMELHNPSLV
jgi:DNA-binding NtrC family response regulator